MIWVTADLHLCHRNILKYCNRPFDNIYQHDEVLITNWNSVVKNEDHVYCLGDFGLGSPKRLASLAEKLHGKIYLIKGNHDKSTIKSPCVERFEWIKDVHFLTIQEAGKTHEFFLSHYSHRVWPKSHHGTVHLFGHSHGNLMPEYNQIDVGVDSHNFFPINVSQIVQRVKKQNEELDKNKN